MTLYRWWPSPGALAFEAYSTAVQDTLAFPDTGDLEADLSTHYTRPRRQLAVQRLGTARERGQVRDDVDLEVVVDQLWGACYQRLPLPDQPLDAAFIDALIANPARHRRELTRHRGDVTPAHPVTRPAR